MKRIAVATTGGDAPGMNAAIRAITRIGISKNLQVIGFKDGWDGLVKNDYVILTKRSVGGILHQGGTILRTSRSSVLRTQEGLEQAAENIKLNDIDAFFVIGGNGSFAAANLLSKHTNIPFIGIPGTIDNDVYGTNETIGFDTAVNSAVKQIDNIRDTANSHNRIFITVVMGRKNGFIALNTGIAVGASLILIPEESVSNQIDNIITVIKKNQAAGKKSGIIVAAEGIDIDIRELAEIIKKETSSKVRVNILGYTQRGGNPTARSRLLANLFVKYGIETIFSQEGSFVMTLDKGSIKPKPISEIIDKERKIDLELLDYYKILSS